MTVQMIKTDADEYLTNAKVTVFDEDKEEIYHVAAGLAERGHIMKKRKLSFTSVGGSSILTIFAVL